MPAGMSDQRKMERFCLTGGWRESDRVGEKEREWEAEKERGRKRKSRRQGEKEKQSENNRWKND